MSVEIKEALSDISESAEEFVGSGVVEVNPGGKNVQMSLIGLEDFCHQIVGNFSCSFQILDLHQVDQEEGLEINDDFLQLQKTNGLSLCNFKCLIGDFLKIRVVLEVGAFTENLPDEVEVVGGNALSVSVGVFEGLAGMDVILIPDCAFDNQEVAADGLEESKRDRFGVGVLLFGLSSLLLVSRRVTHVSKCILLKFWSCICVLFIKICFFYNHVNGNKTGNQGYFHCLREVKRGC